MILRKFEIAEIQLNRAIILFLEEDDFISSLTLAGASEEILGKQLTHEGKTCAFDYLHVWLQKETNEEIRKNKFSGYANRPRNSLKHFGNSNENPIEIFRWETIQMLMRAIANYCALGNNPTAQMKKFKHWLDKNEAVYEKLE